VKPGRLERLGGSSAGLACLVWLGVGCSGSLGSTATAGPDAPQPLAAAFVRTSPEELERVRKLAPDFLARAERAAVRARGAQAAGTAAAKDYESIAGLLLAAAAAEADRIELERTLLAQSLERDDLARAAAAERRLQLVLDAELRRARAARVALAADDRAVPSSAVRAGSDASAQPSAAGLLRDRARSLLAAARALGADRGRLEQAEGLLATATSERAAREALREAERLIPAQR